jgi:hypothetical protein
MTRGRGGWLGLPRTTRAFATPRRSPGTLRARRIASLTGRVSWWLILAVGRSRQAVRTATRPPSRSRRPSRVAAAPPALPRQRPEQRPGTEKGAPMARPARQPAARAVSLRGPLACRNPARRPGLRRRPPFTDASSILHPAWLINSGARAPAGPLRRLSHAGAAGTRRSLAAPAVRPDTGRAAWAVPFQGSRQAGRGPREGNSRRHDAGEVPGFAAGDGVLATPSPGGCSPP